MNKLFISLWMTIMSLSAFTQQYHQNAELTLTAKFIRADIFSNIYLVNDRNVLIKYDSTGKVIQSQKFMSYGDLDNVDVRDPLQTVLFFSSQNRIVVLDKNLVELQNIELGTQPVEQFTAGCKSNQNGFWLYDPDQLQLRKIDPSLSLVYESPKLTFIPLKRISPIYLIERVPYLFAQIENYGISIFDQYGAFLSTIRDSNILTFDILRDNIYYLKDGRIFSSNIKSYVRKEVTLPPHSSAILEFRITEDKLILRDSTSLKIYSYTL